MGYRRSGLAAAAAAVLALTGPTRGRSRVRPRKCNDLAGGAGDRVGG